MAELKILVAANIADVATLTKVIATAKAEELAAEIIQISTEKTDALDVNEELTKQLSTLTKALQEAKKESSKAVKEEFPSFTLGEETFEVVIDSAYVKGELKTAKEIAASKDLQEFLVKRQSGVIRKK